MTNLGPAHSEPGPSQAPVQDVDAETHLSMHPSFRLVCSNQAEGRLLPCLDPPLTQTVSPLCIRRASIPVQGPPLRAIPVASCLHQGHRGSPCPAKGSRHSRSQLPRRLAHTGPVSSTVVQTQGYGAQSPQLVEASGQPGKEQTLPYAVDLFSRHGVGLGQPHSTSLNRACSVKRWAWCHGTYRVSVTPSCRHTFSPLADLAFLRAGVPLAQVSRHVVVSTDASTMGWGAMCNGHPAAVAYQLPRVTGSMACSAPLQNAATREACTGPYRQHCDRCIHRPPRQSTLPLHVATRPPFPPLESEASEVASRRSHLR